MIARNLAIACCAMLAVSMTACGTKDATDGGTPDTGAATGDSGTPDTGKTVIPPDCDPACGTGEKCDKNQTPPACVAICNPPIGCKAQFEVCNETTTQCDAVSCGGNQCEKGQACFNPTTGAAGGSTCTCLPERTSGTGATIVDTCASYGKVCDYKGAASKCVLPKDKADCIPAVGCATGWDCVSLGAQGSICLQKCMKNSECDNIIDYCETTSGSSIQNHCWYNICAQPQTGMSPDPTERTKYFQPCEAANAADGTCYPLRTRDSANKVVDIGVCFQNGTAPSQGACDFEATRATKAGYTDLCPANETCSRVAPDATKPGTFKSVCRPVCNSAPPGALVNPVKDCAAGQRCQDASGAAATEMKEARLGICFKSCDLFGTDVCGSDAIGDTLGCSPSTLEGLGVCRALVPNAPTAAEAACALTADPRNECGDRLYCRPASATATAGKCYGFCDTTVCTSTTQVCSTCAPTTAACGVGSSALNNQNVLPNNTGGSDLVNAGKTKGHKLGVCTPNGTPAPDAGTPAGADAGADAATPAGADAATLVPDVGVGLPDTGVRLGDAGP